MKNLLLFLAGLVMLAGTPVLPVPDRVVQVPETVKTPTAVVYVYEKDESAIPVGVTAGINRLNRDRKLTATLFERDTVDGSGHTPDQYRQALVAAKEATLPALVVLSGSSVVRVVKAPKTEGDVLEAIK